MMKALTASTLAILLGLSGAALAQSTTSSGTIAPGSANGQRNGDAPGAHPVPGAPPSTSGYSNSDRTDSIGGGAGSPSHSSSSNGSSSSMSGSGAR